MTTRPSTFTLPIVLCCAFAVLGCQEKKLGPSPIKIALSGRKHDTSADGRNVAFKFKMTAENLTQTKQSGYLFVWALNSAPIPPTRGVWPASAEPQLGNSRHELIVSTPSLGFRIELAPGADFQELGEIPILGGRQKFREYGYMLFDDQGEMLVNFACGDIYVVQPREARFCGSPALLSRQVSPLFAALGAPDSVPPHSRHWSGATRS